MATTNRYDNLKTLIMQARLLGGARYVRTFLFWYAAICGIFWLLNCMEVDWLYKFEFLFKIPYRFVTIFYKPHGVSVDFSLAIIGCLSLGLGFIIDYIINSNYENVINQISKIESAIKREQAEKKEKAKRKYVPQQETSENFDMPYASFEPVFENPKLVFLIMPKLKKILKSENDFELTFREVDLLKQKINKRLSEDLSYSEPMRRDYHKKNLYLVYKDFNYTDDFIYYLKPTLNKIVPEFKKLGIKINFCYVFSAISDAQTLEAELDCMDTILSLNFIGDYIATDRFKEVYSATEGRKYSLELIGEYNLSKNLAVKNNRPLYKLITAKGGTR